MYESLVLNYSIYDIIRSESYAKMSQTLKDIYGKKQVNVRNFSFRYVKDLSIILVLGDLINSTHFDSVR